jgi:hypothetical protein
VRGCRPSVPGWIHPRRVMRLSPRRSPGSQSSATDAMRWMLSLTCKAHWSGSVDRGAARTRRSQTGLRQPNQHLRIAAHRHQMESSRVVKSQNHEAQRTGLAKARASDAGDAPASGPLAHACRASVSLGPSMPLVPFAHIRSCAVESCGGLFAEVEALQLDDTRQFFRRIRA